MKRWIHNHIRFMAPVLLLLSGTFVLFSGAISSKVVSASNQSSVTIKPVIIPKGVEEIKGTPIRIIVPSAGVDLQVDKGYYNTRSQTWTLSDIHAEYATVTPPVNNIGGNTFIYGHDTKTVFANLSKMKTGDMALIKTDNGKSFYYIFRDAKDVKPTDLSLFEYEGKPILTVQTCSGAWYQNRRLFVFDFVRAQ
jgi:LPXTG-site transpeptidase (sortase) family protein